MTLLNSVRRINVELIHCQHVLKTCWDGFAKDELMKRLACKLQKDQDPQFANRDHWRQFSICPGKYLYTKKKIAISTSRVHKKAKRIFNHIHWDHIMAKSFTFWEIPSDNFQFIWIQSNVLLLSSRTEQEKGFIAGWLWPGWDRC